MRTLALLAALLFLALQVQAKPLQETADQVPTQDLFEAEEQDQLVAEDQDQLEAIDQEISSFGGDDRLARDTSDLRRATICICRKKICICKKKL